MLLLRIVWFIQVHGVEQNFSGLFLWKQNVHMAYDLPPSTCGWWCLKWRRRLLFPLGVSFPQRLHLRVLLVTSSFGSRTFFSHCYRIFLTLICGWTFWRCGSTEILSPLLPPEQLYIDCLREHIFPQITSSLILSSNNRGCWITSILNSAYCRGCRFKWDEALVVFPLFLIPSPHTLQ